MRDLADLPREALLHRYVGTGAYTDCFVTEVPRSVSHAEYVEAFYTTWVFRLERFILGIVVSRTSTDAEASQLAAGTIEKFAAWAVEARAKNQLLLCDYMGRTRSWLMVAPAGSGRTRLFFGSAVVPVRDPRTGQSRMGSTFTALLGFHKLYSRVLLHAARSRLIKLEGKET